MGFKCWLVGQGFATGVLGVALVLSASVALPSCSPQPTEVIDDSESSAVVDEKTRESLEDESSSEALEASEVDSEVADAETMPAETTESDFKTTFTARLDVINADKASDARMGGTTMDMIEAGNDYYERYDLLLNDVYSYVDGLSYVDSESLADSQQEWESDVEARVRATTDEYGGGSLTGPAVLSAEMEMQEARIRELIDMIQDDNASDSRDEPSSEDGWYFTQLYLYSRDTGTIDEGVQAHHSAVTFEGPTMHVTGALWYGDSEEEARSKSENVAAESPEHDFIVADDCSFTILPDIDTQSSDPVNVDYEAFQGGLYNQASGLYDSVIVFRVEDGKVVEARQGTVGTG